MSKNGVYSDEIKVHAYLTVNDDEVLETGDTSLFDISFDYYLDTNDESMRISINHVKINPGGIDITKACHVIAEELVWKHLYNTDYEIFKPLQFPEEYICGRDIDPDYNDF